MGGGSRQEALRGGGDQRGQASLGFRGIKAAAHQVHPGLLRCGSLLGGFHVDMSQLTLSLQLLEVEDGVFLSRTEHSQRLPNRGPFSNPAAASFPTPD